MSDVNISDISLRRILIGIVLVTFLPACSSLISSAGSKIADNLSYAILNHNDSEIVKDASPSYLLMIDGFLRDDPDNASLLRAGASLYSAYSEIYVKDNARAKKLTEKGLEYALRAMCIQQHSACSLKDKKFDEFEKIITAAKDVPTLYILGASWAGWIQARKEDWNAVADIARVESVMLQIVKLNERYQDGAAHLYLGVLATLLPPALGGKPENGKTHFEKAIELSHGKNLMAKVIYARQYARLMFDRELHDRLLKEVTAAAPNAPGYTLMNTLAQKEATELLESADGYF
jgi:hypothetical protein